MTIVAFVNLRTQKSQLIPHNMPETLVNVWLWEIKRNKHERLEERKQGKTRDIDIDKIRNLKIHNGALLSLDHPRRYIFTR